MRLTKKELVAIVKRVGLKSAKAESNNSALRAAAARHLLKLRAERNRFFGAELGTFQNERFWNNAQADIVAAIAVEDREAIIKAAKQSGNQMARNTPMSIKQKLPESFQAIGAPMHMGFEEFAIRAETDDMKDLTAQLAQLMGKCMACHAAFTVN